MQTKDTDYTAAQDNSKEKTAFYEKELAELRQEVNGEILDLPKNRGAYFYCLRIIVQAGFFAD